MKCNAVVMYKINCREAGCDFETEAVTAKDAHVIASDHVLDCEDGGNYNYPNLSHEVDITETTRITFEGW